MIRPPWGTTAQEALRWGFNALGRSAVLPVSLADMIGGGSTHGTPAFTRLDAQMQAAVIREHVDRLANVNPAASSLLWAAYLPRPLFERQPGRAARDMVDYWYTPRRKHINAVAWHIMGQQGTGQHRIRGYMEIVTQYTIGEESLRRVRDLLAMDMNRTSQVRQRCYQLLEELHDTGIDLLDARLKQAGIIEYETDQTVSS